MRIEQSNSSMSRDMNVSISEEELASIHGYSMKEAVRLVAQRIADDFLALHGKQMLKDLKPERVLGAALQMAAERVQDRLEKSIKIEIPKPLDET